MAKTFRDSAQSLRRDLGTLQEKWQGGVKISLNGCGALPTAHHAMVLSFEMAIPCAVNKFRYLLFLPLTSATSCIHSKDLLSSSSLAPNDAYLLDFTIKSPEQHPYLPYNSPRLHNTQLRRHPRKPHYHLNYTSSELRCSRYSSISGSFSLLAWPSALPFPS